MTTTAPAFGERVVCTATLSRYRSSNLRAWERDKTAPFEAMVIGWRTLSDGRMEGGGGNVDGWLYFPEPADYKPTRHFKAYLVVRDERSAPVLALPEDLTPIDKENRT